MIVDIWYHLFARSRARMGFKPLPWAYRVATRQELALWRYQAHVRAYYARAARTWYRDFVKPMDDELWATP